MMHQLKQFLCCKITFKNYVLRHVAMHWALNALVCVGWCMCTNYLYILLSRGIGLRRQNRL